MLIMEYTLWVLITSRIPLFGSRHTLKILGGGFAANNRLRTSWTVRLYFIDWVRAHSTLHWDRTQTALIDWTRILAPCILGHDSLVPVRVVQSGNETTATNSWKFARFSHLQVHHALFFHYCHCLSDVRKCLDPSLSRSAQNFDDTLTTNRPLSVMMYKWGVKVVSCCQTLVASPLSLTVWMRVHTVSDNGRATRVWQRETR